MQIKVISWNIWSGKYQDEIIQFLKKTNADIIGLQEVREEHVEGKKRNSAYEIAKELGYDCVYYKAFSDDRHEKNYDLGNAILSKWPIANHTCHFLSTLDTYKKNAETEPRIAIQAEIKVNDTILHVFTTHLAYSLKFNPSHMRDSQVENLIELLPRENTILMGDFNSTPESRDIKKIGKVLTNADQNLTDPTFTVYPFHLQGFTVTELKYRIDYIFVSNDIAVKKSSVEDSKASDHLPVSAVLDVHN